MTRLPPGFGPAGGRLRPGASSTWSAASSSATSREGALPTYQLAFLMADYLVERNGFDRMKRYFGSFARSRDRQRNFRVAFGTTVAAFELDVLAHLKVAAGPALD